MQINVIHFRIQHACEKTKANYISGISVRFEPITPYAIKDK